MPKALLINEKEFKIDHSAENFMIDTFSLYHPFINFFYFCVVLLFSMFNQHPVFLGISYAGAFSYAVLFNHYGVTMLYYVESSGNWITLESLVYGIVLGAVMFVVIQWFSCYNKIMTTDKFVYLFGKLIPALSLILSMALRFVPSFLGQLKFIRNGQKAMGKDISEGKLLDRIHAGLNMLSILITWALENAIETSDSMRSRGYGLKGRTAFSIYHFTRKDKYVFGIMIGLFTVFTGGCMRGASYATYDPRIILAGFSINGYEAPVVASKAWTILTYVSFGIFCFLPIIIDVIESVSFSHSRRKSAVNLEMTYKKIYETLEEKGTVL